MTHSRRVGRRRAYWQAQIDAAQTERARMVAAIDYLRATLAVAPAALADRIYRDLSDQAVRSAEEAWEAMA